LGVTVPPITTARINTNATLTCHVFEGEKDVSYVWYTDSTEVLPPGLTNQNLTLTNVTNNLDRNVYTCVATSRNGIMGNASGVLRIEGKWYFIVYYLPKVNYYLPKVNFVFYPLKTRYKSYCNIFLLFISIFLSLFLGLYKRCFKKM